MKYLLRFITLCLMMGPAVSLALPPPPSQAAPEVVYVAELRTERGSAARFTRRGLSGLPPAPAFQGLLRATPLLPMAPERRFRGLPHVAADRPASMLRRLVLLQYAPGTDATARLRDLQSSGFFTEVGLVPARPTRLTGAQFNSEPLGQPNPDLHRWQWALAHVRAHQTGAGPGAWELTSGRAMVGSIDSGLMVTHPDLGGPASVGLPLGNFRQHISARVFSNQGLAPPVIRPGELSILGTPPHPRMPPHHGTHVNTLMAAPINGTGIAGVCPQCTLQTFRAEFDREIPLAAILAGRFGMGALNLSIEPSPIDSSPKFFGAYRLALIDLIEQDVVVVAAAGNQRTPRDNWRLNGVPNASETVPHSIPAVMKIGATDFDRHLWDESRIVALLDAGRRHPVAAVSNLCTIPNEFDCIPWVIGSFRCSNQYGGDQCGSSFGTIEEIIDLVAPGAQVIGGMVHPSQPPPPPPFVPGVYSQVPPHPENLYAWPPGEVGLGVSQPPNAGIAVRLTNPAQLYWGPMTGTSMSAPHVTATAGLMRSINPLLSAAAVRTGLRDGANDNVPGYTRPRMGDGLLDARKSVELAAGKARGTVLQNRLVPMLAFYARASLEPSEITTEELEGLTVEPVHAWLHTTNPSLASTAMRKDIYTSPSADFSPTQNAAYLPSHLLMESNRRIGIPIPTTRYELPIGAGALRQVASSFFVYTTANALPGAPAPLVPLYRLTTHHGAACAAEQRKHLYTTRQSQAELFITGQATCGLPAYDMGYRFEGIEGYVYDRVSSNPKPDVLKPLYQGYNQTLNTTALIVGNERCTTAFSGYIVNTATTPENRDFLGWVYPTFEENACPINGPAVAPSTTALDKDSDGLPDGVEVALRLNEESANGDCEGANDTMEYGFANLPDDPMSLTPNCADGRVTVIRPNPNATGEARVVFSNPVGPATVPADDVVRVTFYEGGGWPTVIPAACRFDTSDIGLAYKHYLCSLTAALPAATGSVVEFVFQVEARTNPSTRHQAVVLIRSGFTDPGLALNNISEF